MVLHDGLSELKDIAKAAWIAWDDAKRRRAGAWEISCLWEAYTAADKAVGDAEDLEKRCES